MKSIQAVELKKLLDNDEVFLIDIRTPSEYNNGHITNSVLLSLDQISPDVLPSNNKAIVIYCHVGIRSMHACISLLEQGCNCEVYSLTGGIIAWEHAGFSIEK